MTEVVNFILWVLLGATVCYACYKIGVRDGDIDSTNKMRNLELLSQSFILSEQRRLENLQDGIDGVTSVSLSPLRYIELIRAEKELKELKDE